MYFKLCEAARNNMSVEGRLISLPAAWPRAKRTGTEKKKPYPSSQKKRPDDVYVKTKAAELVIVPTDDKFGSRSELERQGPFPLP